MSVTKEETDLLAIDEHRLHEEWLRQPLLYAEYAGQLADKRAELDTAKSRLDVVVAELDRDIRKMPEHYGIAKITEMAVQNTILLQVKHFKAQERVNTLKHQAAILQAMTEALDQKKKSLENLVVLWLNEYFSEPRVPKGTEGKEKLNEMVRSDVRHGRGKR